MRVFFVLFATMVVALGLASPVSAQPQCQTLENCNVDVTNAQVSASGVTQNNYNYTVPQYLEWVVNDADVQWSAWFKSVGLKEPMVYYYIIPQGGSYTTLCQGDKRTFGADHNNAFYCPIDSSGEGAIVLPTLTFQKMWLGSIFGRNSGVKGDFGAALVVAHEFGHHVQDELTKQLGQTRPAGKYNELLADCFAGNWTWTLYQRAGLEEGDLDEAVAALNAIGDQGASSDPHGTGTERIQALKTGLNGNPFSCFKAYWPQVVR